MNEPFRPNCFALLFLALFLSACSGSQVTEPNGQESSAVAEDEASEGIEAPQRDIPSSPVGSQLEWFLETFNSGSLPTEADVEARFQASFLQSVPAPTFLSIFEELVEELAPLTLVDFEVEPTDYGLTAVLIGRDESWCRLVVGTEEAEPYRINALLITATPWLSPDYEDPRAWLQEVEIPNSPVGAQLTWVLEAFNQAIMPSADEVETHLSPSFLEFLPPPAFLAVLSQLKLEMAPLTIVGFDTEPTDFSLVAIVVDRDDHYHRLQVRTDEGTPDQLQTLLITPADELDPTFDEPENWTELAEALSELAPLVNFAAVELVEDRVEPVFTVNPTLSLGIGSAFKLYVLATLAERVASGENAWDELLAIVDAWKSLPSGVMQLEPEGTEFTLLQYAENMISRSDNTGTDHLMHLLGRERVEAMLATAGHHDPSENIPFVTTREIFVIKLLLGPEERQTYLDGTIEEQRRLLDGFVELDPATAVDEPWDEPRWITDFEYFATAEDLCQVMVTLWRMGQTESGAPVLDILSINPGIPFDSESWPYVGYKGGSEPGVLNMTWLLRRADDRWFVLSSSLNNPAEDVDLGAFVTLMGAASRLLAEE